jgi:hypothetical protein
MRKGRERTLLANAFSTVNRYEPERVKVVRRKHGNAKAEKMKTAIALDEARKQGVDV